MVAKHSGLVSVGAVRRPRRFSKKLAAKDYFFCAAGAGAEDERKDDAKNCEGDEG